MGIRSVAIKKSQDPLEGVYHRDYQLVFMSPEALSVPHYREMLRTDVYCECLVGVAVDEAHCIAEW